MGAIRRAGLVGASLAIAQLAFVVPGSVPAAGQAADPAQGDSASVAKARRPAVVVNAGRRGSGVSPFVLGSNHRFAFRGYGMWNTTTDHAEPRAIQAARGAGIKLLRYPGGSRANFFDWKEAIGPPRQRDCQVFGKLRAGKGVRALYGIHEHMQYANQIGAKTLITMPFLTESVTDAASWVEYMNDPLGGRNPNGGVAWANVRRGNGHPAPFGVHTWTLGNEPYLRNQRFWMSNKLGTALRQYVNGRTFKVHNQQVGKDCRFPNGAARRQQQRELLYPPVKAGTARVTVNKNKWTQVNSLTNHGPDAKVYELDNNTGKLTFGNGVHGAPLPEKANVRASYTSVHAGFSKMRAAMKKVDPSIRVCSEWSRPEFVRYMGKRPYDCLAAHPYQFFSRQFRSPLEAHDALMGAERHASSLVPKLRRKLRHHHRGNVPLVVTEFGAISLNAQPGAPHWDLGMSDALFMASQAVGFVRRGIGVAAGGALTAFNLRATIGHRPRFTTSAWGVTSGQLARVVRSNGRVLGTQVRGVHRRTAGQDKYAVLRTLAVAKGHHAYVVVINRHPRHAVRALLGVRHGSLGGKRISIRSVVSKKAWTYNTAGRPRAVHVVRGSKRVGRHAPMLRYPPHSVTVLSFRIR